MTRTRPYLQLALVVLAGWSVLAIAAPAYAQTPCEDNGEVFLSNDCGQTEDYGCCTYENKVRRCRSATVNNQTTYYLCEKACGGTPPNCGWNPDPFGGLDFGHYACGISGTPEPEGEKPLICRDLCAPQCSGRACGSDGCSGMGFVGTCGSCAPELPLECIDGVCVCQKQCDGKDCGADGCGSFCGFCDAGERCEDGQCVQGACSCAGKQCGDDGCGNPCPPGCDEGLQCVGGSCVCVPNCTNRDCGSNGCGGSCGECNAGGFCTPIGTCCYAACGGKECGPDGCGGVCGDCPAGQACDDSSGQCVLCQPDCGARRCGPDGCGGACGTCYEWEYCEVESGTCLPREAERPRVDVANPPRDVAQDTGTSTPDIPPITPGNDSSGFIVCPPGQVRINGVCQTPLDEGGSGGCAATPATPSSKGALLLSLLALGLIVMRRKPARR